MGVRLVGVTPDRIPEAAAAMAQAMLDEPSGRYLLPDHDEFVEIHRSVYLAAIERGLRDGQVDAWGDPIVGVAIWLGLPAVEDSPPPGPIPPTGALKVKFPPHAVTRVAQFRDALQQLRVQARPGAHAYLDAIGVLSEHRGTGIATQLLDAGHAWADAAGLQCYLDTCSDANIALYRGRGYEVVASIPLADSGLRITAMQRPIGGPQG